MPLGSGWFYNDRSGAVVSELPGIGLLNEALHGLGWHGPFGTKQQAVDFGNSLAAQGKGKAPTGLAGNVGNVAKGAAQDTLSTSGINVGNWLLRIGEALLGIVLLAIGVARITRAVPVATKIAKTAGAGALLA
jgi:hypothetical protein